ncbi:MAG TPA: dihydrofolate reductase family protein [Candidatus Limnocylindrales bacterium]|nr:dihydrofolate reductase family protein [Candidatus Limnocylindrales bacterium]
MRIVVVEFMTLDGVMEAPGYEEHRSGRNGWAMRAETDDPELSAFNGRQINGAAALLFGRTTFNVWAAYWPTAAEPAASIGAHINALPKYVVSKSLVSTDWANTTILRGDLHADVEGIRNLPGGDCVVYGSADLVGGLLELDLVDELRIALFPVILGSGKRLFRDDADLRRLRLVESETTSSGVVLLTYRRTDVAREASEALEPFVWTPDQVETYRALEETNRVLATILFTDIVDSTGRAAAMGDREWRRLLDRHDEAARAEARRWGGEVVKSTGDGVMARFEAPTRAVRAALALHAAARRLGIEIRAAIHTGEVEIRGADLGGIGVHIASRVLSTAGAGDVVVTRTVRDLATGADLRFTSRGPVALKGVPEPWELFAVSLVGGSGQGV